MSFLKRKRAKLPTELSFSFRYFGIFKFVRSMSHCVSLERGWSLPFLSSKGRGPSFTREGHSLTVPEKKSSSEGTLWQALIRKHNLGEEFLIGISHGKTANQKGREWKGKGCGEGGQWWASVPFVLCSFLQGWWVQRSSIFTKLHPEI